MWTRDLGSDLVAKNANTFVLVSAYVIACRVSAEATMTTLKLYGHPVFIQNTFLHINCDFENRDLLLKRTVSCPIIIQSWVTPRKPLKKKKKQHDDDVALQEGRSMVLIDMWSCIVKGARKNHNAKILEGLGEKRMKLRFSMKPDSFIQLVKVMNFNEMDIVVMRSMGIIRDPAGIVNVYLSDEHLHNESMKKMMKQADVIQGLSKTNFFLMKVATDVGLVIRFDPHMSTLEVKKRAEHFYNIESNTIKLERLNGEPLKGRTLRKCNVSPGDCIRVVA